MHSTEDNNDAENNQKYVFMYSVCIKYVNLIWCDIMTGVWLIGSGFFSFLGLDLFCSLTGGASGHIS